jgi:hypothetical protein
VQYPTTVSAGYLQELKTTAEDQEVKGGNDDTAIGAEGAFLAATPDVEVIPSVEDMEMPTSDVQPRHVSTATLGIVARPAPTKWSSDEAVAQVDLPDVTLRFPEKKRLHWSNKTCTWVFLS